MARRGSNNAGKAEFISVANGIGQTDADKRKRRFKELLPRFRPEYKETETGRKATGYMTAVFQMVGTSDSCAETRDILNNAWTAAGWGGAEVPYPGDTPYTIRLSCSSWAVAMDYYGLKYDGVIPSEFLKQAIANVTSVRPYLHEAGMMRG